MGGDCKRNTGKQIALELHSTKVGTRTLHMRGWTGALLEANRLVRFKLPISLFYGIVLFMTAI